MSDAVLCAQDRPESFDDVALHNSIAKSDNIAALFF